MERQPRSPGISDSYNTKPPTTSNGFCSQAYPKPATVATAISVAAIAEDLKDVPFLVRQTGDNFLCDTALHDKIRQSFLSPEACHGAFEARVLLWGPSGQGKRQLCTYVANRVALEDQRTILWIEGRTAVTFIRDLRFAYQLMTGKPHPGDIGVLSQLKQMSQALSRCNSKWLMVVFDLDPGVQYAPGLTTGGDIAAFIPRGQILMTYSPTMRISDVIPFTLDMLPANLTSNSTYILIPLTRSSTSFYSSFLTNRSLLLDWAASVDISQSADTGHLLTISIAAAAASLGPISFEECLRICKHRLRQVRGKCLPLTSPANYLTKFAYFMQFFHEQLSATHRDAADVLDLLLPACPRDIPLRLVEKVLRFQRSNLNLTGSLDLLQSLSIIQVVQLESGDFFLSMHEMVYRWLRTRDNCSGADESEVHRPTLKLWIKVLDQDLPELQHANHHHKYWISLELAMTVINCTEGMSWRYPPLVSLMRKIATFLSRHMILATESKRLLGRALFLTSNLEHKNPDFDVELERLKLHRERARICALTGDHAEAKQELKYARLRLLAQKNPDDVQKSLSFDLLEDCIELALREGDHKQARRLLDAAFAEKSHKPPNAVARLHFWAACCAGDDHLSTLDAIQHSHLAMSYWHSLPEDDRWNGQLGNMLPWVDTHIRLLISMDRGRGALVLMPRLLEQYIEQCPSTHDSLWRMAFWTAREHILIKELEPAEKIVCQVLSLCDFADLEGQSLSWVLSMLEMMGSIYARGGQYYAAELIFRTCLFHVANRRPACAGAEGPFDQTSLRLDLCSVLLIQSKSREVAAARKLAIQNGVDELKGNDWEDMLMKSHKMLIKNYGRALRAAQDRNHDIHNSDDYLLDCHWPSTFSLATQVFGDPFDRIERGLLDFQNDKIFTTKMMTKHSLMWQILALLDTPFMTSCKAGQSDTDPDWKLIFASDNLYDHDSPQRTLSSIWRPCICRRKRLRVWDRELGASGQRWRKQQPYLRGSHRTARSTQRELCQRQITRYFQKQTRYPADACHPNCPCIKANLEGAVLTRQIETDRLHVYKAYDAAEQTARDKAFYQQMRSHRNRYGKYAAIPHGMAFRNEWRYPDHPTENQDPGARFQNTLLWAPDFVLVGSPEDNWGMLGQDENALFLNPAMRLVCPGWTKDGLPDLPNIVITSHELGEKVRGNTDRLVYKPAIKYDQTNIKDYLVINDSNEDNYDPDVFVEEFVEDEHGNLTPRPPRRRRNGKKISGDIPRRVRNRSHSTSSSLIYSRRSRSQSSSRDRINTDKQRNQPGQREKLKIFNINSLHSNGPIFDTDHLSSSIPIPSEDSTPDPKSPIQQPDPDNEYGTSSAAAAAASSSSSSKDRSNPTTTATELQITANDETVAETETEGYQHGQPLSPIDEEQEDRNEDTG